MNIDIPLVSIIVPVYQAELFLKKSVESIINQTLSNIEIILVNDGSKDGSGKICDMIAASDKRVRVIHKENGGQSSARNVGINTATGKYIGFMDNDDFLYPDMCMCLYENAEQNDADISAGSFITKNELGITSHDKHTHKTYIYDNSHGVEAYLSREIVDIYVWTKLYRRDFLNRNHIRFEEGRSDEDWLFNHAAFFAAQKTVMQDKPIYDYLERADSTCRTFHKKELHKYLDDTCYRLNKIENDVKNNYPSYLILSKIQTIKACIRMLFIISKHKREGCEPYYTWIKKYFRKNAKIVIQQRRYWGMSWIGTFLAAYMPAGIYFYLKKNKHRNDIE